MSRRYRSSDPSALSNIESLHYVPCTAVDPGGSLTYGNWRDNEADAGSCSECWGRGERRTHGLYREIRERCVHCRGTGRVRAVRLTVIDLATGSDYSGNLVEVSNYRTLKREFPWLVELSGGYGTRGLAYLGKRENQNPALLEAIDALTQYPIYSDDDHSELEWETAAQAWEDDGRKDFAKALAEMWSIVDPDEDRPDDVGYDEGRLLDDETHRAALDTLWRDCCELMRGGEEHLNESGESIYFPIRDIIHDIRADRAALYQATWNPDDNRPIVEKLETLKAACRYDLNTDKE